MSRRFFLPLLLSVIICTGCVDRNERLVGELDAYWNDYDFTSYKGLSDIEAAEERFADYAELLNKVPTSAAVQSVERFMHDVSANEVSYYVYIEWFEIYFHSLGSPYRNDAVFDAYLNCLLDDGNLDEYERLRPASQKRLLAKNRIGELAEDFTMKSAGREFRLSDLRSKSVLLFFVDAECFSCREMMDEVNASRRIMRAVKRNELQLVAVALNGGSRVERLAEEYPQWTVAVCPTDEIASGEKYDMSLTPSYFLISAEGVVETAYETDVSTVSKFF